MTVNMPRTLPAYAALIEERAPFPPILHAADRPEQLTPVAAGFPPAGEPTHSASATPTGPGPSAPHVAEALHTDPRTPPGPAPLR